MCKQNKVNELHKVDPSTEATSCEKDLEILDIPETHTFGLADGGFAAWSTVSVVHAL